MNALVVDDDAMNRELLRRMLIRLGWHVDDAREGRSAIAACERTRYELVLLDLLMPGLDGTAAARTIREQYEREGVATCLLAVTGSLCGDVESAVFDGILAKPFVLEELSAIIARALHARAILSSDGAP